MKRHLLSMIASASLAGLSFTACDKKADTSTSPPPPTTNADAPKAAETSSAPAAPSKPAETSKAPVAPVAPASAADVAKVASNYGFVARLPKDTEVFSSLFRLHDLWTGLKESKWAATLLNLPMVKENEQMKERWNSPEATKALEVLEGVFGEEFTVAVPAGFTSKLVAWQSFFTKIISTVGFEGFAGGGANDELKKAQIKKLIPELRPLFAKCEVLPVIIAFKGAKMRKEIEEGTGMLKGLVTEQVPKAEQTHFKVGDKYEFDSIAVSGQIAPPVAVTQMELQLTDLLGNEAEAKKTMEELMAKRFEIAWGWVEDYFVVSIGADHAHLKLAPNEAGSALAIAEVGRRATQFADKKPNGMSYVSKGFLDAMTGKIEFANYLKAGADELQKQERLTAEQATAIVSDLRRLEAKVQAHFATVNDSSVQVDFWDGGFRSEIFGGGRLTGADASKPLTFSPLATASTLLFLDSRTNSAHSSATSDLVEDAVGMVAGWYEKFGKKFVPESERQGAAFIEATAFPAIKEFWKQLRTLGKAFGDESAFLVDTAGAVPELPNVPAFFTEGKMPRVALVMELKNRAALSEAWTGIYSLAKELTAVQGITLPAPVEKTEGGTETYSIDYGVPTGDLLPHVAINGNRWLLSTSPSYTKELVGKKPAALGGPAATQFTLNTGALYDLADVWLKVAEKHGEEMGPGFQNIKRDRPMIDAVLKLARSWQGFEWRLSEEAGQTHHSLHLKLQDVK